MILPYDASLSIQSLSRGFSDMSESYKIFWFSGVLDIVKSGRTIATFDEIINHMIIDAWYMVSEYHLNLGPADTLEKLVLYTQRISGLKTSAKSQEILDFLAACEDKQLKEYKNILTHNVPYRFQAPFMADFKGKAWKRVADVIDRVNCDDNLIYHFGSGFGLNRTIEISKEWLAYFQTNQAIVTGWIEFNLITYLQKRNPSVPGISNKLYPPGERNLEKAKKFWKSVIDYTQISNIYSADGSIMSADDVSLDHFVPWSYVAHDELWNLVPTTKSLNSSKSNNLPNWNRFFPMLAEIEYCSYRAIWDSNSIHELFEKCCSEHVNSMDVLNKLYVPGIGKSDFMAHLEDIIKPVYNAAKNLGFGEWQV